MFKCKLKFKLSVNDQINSIGGLSSEDDIDLLVDGKRMNKADVNNCIVIYISLIRALAVN